MTKLPPGIIYLIPRIPQLLIGPISTYLLLKLSQTFYGIFYFSTWVTVILLILSGPAIFAISLAWNDFKNYRAARAIGAVLPPRILDYSPGNVYSIWKEIKHEKTGYFGEILSFSSFFFFLCFFCWTESENYIYSFSGDGFKDQAANSGGFAFNLRFLFQNRVRECTLFFLSWSKYNASLSLLNAILSLDGHGRTWTHQGFLKTTFMIFSILKTDWYR